MEIAVDSVLARRYRGEMQGTCLLCEASLPDVLEASWAGTLCGACAALSPAQRDVLRTQAMTRMLTRDRLR